MLRHPVVSDFVFVAVVLFFSFYFDDFICIIFCDDFKPGSCLHV